MDNPSVIILITLLLSAFFSGIEIAFISANKLLIELKNKQGSLYAKILSPYLTNPSKFISTTLIGNNIALVIYAIYMAQVLSGPISSIIPNIEEHRFALLLIQTIISTLFVLVTAEFIPKVLFRINPDLILRILIYPFQIFYYLISPLVYFINWLAKVFLNKVLKVEFSESGPAFTRVDLDEYISEINETNFGDDVELDTEIFRNALDFSSLKVRECMTPRADLVSIDINLGIEELYKKFLETELSKILVHDGNPDQIIGYVHLKEIFKKPKSIKSILYPIEIVTETMNALDLINKFSRTRKSIALVVDELGGTAGIVTIEDVMEEIFGEIEDEHDIEDLLEEKISDTQYRLSARHEIDYLNDEFDFNIEEGDYHTLGGFILARHENIPKAGEKIIIDQFEFTIETVKNTGIGTVNLRILENN